MNNYNRNKKKEIKNDKYQTRANNNNLLQKQ